VSNGQRQKQQLIIDIQQACVDNKSKTNDKKWADVFEVKDYTTSRH
jgi:hypothetical protein